MGPTCLRMSSFIFFHDMTKQPPKSAGEEDTKPEEGLSSSLFYVPNQSFHVEDSVRLDLLFLGLAPSILSPAAKLNELCSFVANMTEQKRVVGRRNGERPPHEKEAVDRERRSHTGVDLLGFLIVVDVGESRQRDAPVGKCSDRANELRPLSSGAQASSKGQMRSEQSPLSLDKPVPQLS